LPAQPLLRLRLKPFRIPPFSLNGCEHSVYRTDPSGTTRTPGLGPLLASSLPRPGGVGRFEARTDSPKTGPDLQSPAGMASLLSPRPRARIDVAEWVAELLLRQRALTYGCGTLSSSLPRGKHGGIAATRLCGGQLDLCTVCGGSIQRGKRDAGRGSHRVYSCGIYCESPIVFILALRFSV
jgi:hypothetical protein